MIKSIFPYMGNKHNIANWIISYFRPHRIYCEVFGGTFAVGLNKQRSKVEIYNDKNHHLSNLFEVMRTKKDELIKEFTSYNVSEVFYNKVYKNHDPIEFGDVNAAAKYLYIMVVSGMGKYNGGFMAKRWDENVDNIFNKKIPIINAVHNRIKPMIIVSRDFRRVIKSMDESHTLFYLDPPYKGTESYYKTIIGDFTMKDHIDLSDILKSIKGKFVLSYEDDEIIRALYDDDRFYIVSKQKDRLGKKPINGVAQKSTEILIMNYRPEMDLFSSRISDVDKKDFDK